MDSWFRNLVDSGLQRPANGVIQLINRTTGSELLPELHVVAKPLDREPGTVEWYFGQFGAGTGILADLMLLRTAGRGVAAGLGLKTTGSRLGLLTLDRTSDRRMLATRTFAGASVEAFVLGATYEGVFRPVHEDEQHEFWQARFKNGLSGGATMATFEMSLRGLRSATGKLTSEESPLLLQWGRNVAIGGTAGFGSGVVNATTRSLVSDGEFRASDILTSGKQYAFAGALLHGAMPVLLNPVQKTTLNPERQQQMLQLLSDQHGIGDATPVLIQQFKDRAAREGISLQEQARTFATTANLLRRDAAPGVNPEHLPKLTIQCLGQAADPRLIDQGANNTCNVTTIEGRLYSRTPSDAIRVVTNLATRGKFRTADGATISLPDDQLTPDAEALSLINTPGNKGPESAARTYASQLFQLGAANTYWKQAILAPDGRAVDRGQLEYRLQNDATNPHAVVKRESIVINSGDKPEVLFINGERVNSPHINLGKMLEIERALTGRLERSRMLDVYSTSESTRDVAKPGSINDLRSQLSRLKEEKRLPITLGMDIRQDAFWKKLYGDNPITVRSFQDTFYHVLQIVDYDADNNKVYVDGSWGTAKDFLGRPEGKPALSVEDIWDMMQDGATKVTRLELDNNKSVQEPALSAVRQWPNLKEVSLHNTNATDSAMSYFESLQKIESFDLSGTKITNAALKQLATHTNLERLNLAFTGVNGNLADLSTLTKLKALDLSGLSISAPELAALHALRGLKDLTVSAETMTAETVRQLGTSLPDVFLTFRPPTTDSNVWTGSVSFDRLADGKVYGLSISYGTIDTTSKMLDRISHFPDLNSISLRNCKIPANVANRLKNLNTLQRLDLSSTEMTDGMLAGITGLSNLATISLDETNVTGLGLERYPKLADVNLRKSAASDASLASLERLPGLLRIDLSDTKITDNVAAHLAKCSALREICLSNTSVSDKGVREVLRNPSIRILDVSRTRTADMSMANVASSSLQHLKMDQTDVSSAGIKQLFGHRHLECLNVSRSKIDDSCADALASLSLLRELHVAFTNFTDAGVAKLAPLNKLRNLNLSGTRISDASVDVLIQMAPQYLDVTDTGVTAEGLKKLVVSNKINWIVVSTTICSDEMAAELSRLNPRCHVSRMPPIIGRDLLKGY